MTTKFLMNLSTATILPDLRALIIDMDGVLWRGDTALPGFNLFFDALRCQQISFTLATNNSTKTQAQYAQKCAKFGVKVAPEEILTSAVAATVYLQNYYPPGTRVYVIGKRGIREAVAKAGFVIVEREAQVVVVGLDVDLTYAQLKQATLLINDGADFIGANPDLTLPTEEGLTPGNGVILAAITAATGKKPTIIGKPERFMFELALKRLAANPAQTAIIGDRLDTDILGGQWAGLKTILVLSGATKLQDLSNSQVKPDWIFNGIEDLV